MKTSKLASLCVLCALTLTFAIQLWHKTEARSLAQPLPAPTPVPVCVTPPPNMVAWFPGEGNADDIQSGNNGALRNGATFASGMVGQGFSLDGADDYVEIPDSASLKITGAITIDAWVEPDVVTGNYPGRGIVSKYDGVTGQASYILWITTTGEFVFGVYKKVGALPP